MNDRKAITLGASAFILIGIILLALGIADVFKQLDFIGNAKVTEGTIGDIKQYYYEIGSNPNLNRGVANQAIIQFQLSNQEVIQFIHEYGLLEDSLKTGEKVDVLYHRDYPQHAMVNSFAALWAGYLVIISMGFFFMGAGYLVFRLF